MRRALSLHALLTILLCTEKSPLFKYRPLAKDVHNYGKCRKISKQDHLLKPLFGEKCVKLRTLLLHIVAEIALASQSWNFQTIVVKNRVGRGLSYRPASLHRLLELIPWNRFLGPLKV